MWSEFNPVKETAGIVRKAVDGHNAADGKKMGYWLSITGSTASYVELLKSSTGNGQCGAFANLFMQAAGAVGIDASSDFDIVEIKSKISGENLFVKKLKFGDCIVADDLTADTAKLSTSDDVQHTPVDTSVSSGDTVVIFPGDDGVLNTTAHADDDQRSGSRTGTYPYLLDTTGVDGLPWSHPGDAAEQDGVEGQGNSDPHTHFQNHFVVRHSGAIYDASYGIGGVGTDEEDHEALAFDGFIIAGTAIGAGNIVVARKNTSTVDCDYTAVP